MQVFVHVACVYIILLDKNGDQEVIVSVVHQHGANHFAYFFTSNLPTTWKESPAARPGVQSAVRGTHTYISSDPLIA